MILDEYKFLNDSIFHEFWYFNDIFLKNGKYFLIDFRKHFFQAVEVVNNMGITPFTAGKMFS
jgi:hypothetical protein